mgnify:CR=1 FL=1
MAANGTSLDVSGVQLVDSKIRDNINSVVLFSLTFR